MSDYAKTTKLRFQLMGAFFALISLVIVYRMYTIGVVKHAYYLDSAQAQQRFEQVQMAQRGQILVHDSVVDSTSYYPLAFDVKNFSVWIVPNHVKNKQKAADQLETLLSVPSKTIFDKINNEKMYIPALKKNLTLAEADAVMSENVEGVYVTPEYNRYYPENNLASQILGFVNSSGEGNYGFEGHYNNELKGKEGDVVGEKDTLGRMISLLEQRDPQNGTSYVLTIDRSVQYYVEKKLTQAITDYQAEAGTVIVMDIQTGGIVAMASSPNFNPNDYQTQAQTDPSLFMNPAIAGQFEPGSIFKPIIMSMAMDKGLVTPDTSSNFGESIEVQGYTIHTAEGKAFGQETMTQVLQNSDNVGMVWVGNKMSNADIYNYIKSYGFFDRTGIDLDSEVAGNAPPLKSWQDINRATISFGQGIAVTPIELLSSYAAIANNGKYIYPHVVDKIVYSDGTEKQVEKQEGQQIISQKTAEDMRQMLYEVVMKGTAKKAQVPGFKISAKTGTAQIAKAGGGYEDNEEKLGIYIHSAAGFAPTDHPKYAMIVKLTRPKTSKYAESTAVPLFGDISNFLLNYHYRVTPTEPIK